MRRIAAGAVLMLALGFAGRTQAAQTIDAGTPQAGPVLVAGAVAWADAAGVRLSSGRTLVTAPAGARISGLTAGGGRVGYGVDLPGGGAQALSVPLTGGSPTLLATCATGQGRPAVAVGDGFTVVRGCAGTDPTVTVDGTGVGRATSVAAAGPYAAWSVGPTVTVAQALSAPEVVGDVPAGGGWALAPDGSVVTAAAGVGTTMLASTPPGGSAESLGAEPGGVFGLAAGADGTIAFATQSENRAQTLVVRRGGERLEVARFWPEPALSGAVATDGMRVAWFSARCGGTDLTVATIGEPAVDQRGVPCPVSVAADGGLARLVLAPRLSCDTRVAPQPCTARVRVSVEGALIAAGTVGLSQMDSGAVALTADGRRLVQGLARLRADVEVVRPIVGGAPLVTRRAVTFVRR